MKTPIIKSVMKTDLVTLDKNDTMITVDKIFKEQKFHHIPVVNSYNEVVGIISKSDYCMLYDSIDFLRSRFARHYEAKRNKQFFQSLLAEEIMTKKPATLHEEEKISEAIKLFLKNDFHAIPITGENNKLTGILTSYDLIELLSEIYNMQKA